MNRQLKYKKIAIAAMALLAFSCSRDDNSSVDELGPKGTPVATLDVSIGEPSPDTRVGVTVDDNNKKDTYKWINGDIIHLLELNADGTAFTGKRYQYTFIQGSNGKFAGSGAYLGRKFVPVHIRTTLLMTWPNAGATAFDYAMPNIMQFGPWTDDNVKQAYVDNLLFVGNAVELESKTPITLLHTLTQVQLDIKATNAELNGTPIITVRLEANGNDHFASKLRFGVNGALNEAGSTWGKSTTTTVTDANAKLNHADAYRVRVLTRQKSSVSSKVKVWMDNAYISDESSSRTLAVGKVYKATHALKPPSISVSPSSLNDIPRKGTSIKITVTTEGPWSVKSKADWITVNPSSGRGNTQVTLTWGMGVFDYDTYYTSRQGNVVFGNSMRQATFSSRQKIVNRAIHHAGTIWADKPEGIDYNWYVKPGNEWAAYHGSLSAARTTCRNNQGGRLPTADEINALIHSGSGTWWGNKMRYFGPITWWAAGYRDKQEGKLLEKDNQGRYWLDNGQIFIVDKYGQGTESAQTPRYEYFARCVYD